MKKLPNRAGTNTSRLSAATQSKTTHSKPGRRGAPGLAGSDPKWGSPNPRDHSCVYIFDPSAREVVCEIPLTNAKLFDVSIASYRQGMSVDRWIADAIIQKLCLAQVEPAIPPEGAPAAVSAPTAGQAGPITLQLVEAGAHNPLACVEITADELSSIKAARAARNKNIPGLEWSIGQWIKSALTHQASRDLTPGRPLFDLQDAINKAAGLLSVMAISNTKLRADLADTEGRPLSGGIDCGIEILADLTSAELAKAFKASFDYAAGLGREAA